MPIPDLNADGLLPPGIHAATLNEVQTRFGVGSEARRRQGRLLELVVEAAKEYATIKRVLVWGSFVTGKQEPNDLDYSLVVSVDFGYTRIARAHRRFIVPYLARQRYGVDVSYLTIRDYPLGKYVEHMEFVCGTRRGPCGIVEISLRGEITGERQ